MLCALAVSAGEVTRGHSYEDGTLRWRDELRSAPASACGADAAGGCHALSVIVRNETDWRIACTGTIVFAGEEQAWVEGRGEIPPGASAAVLEVKRSASARVAGFLSGCRPLPVPELIVPPECKLEITQEQRAEYPKQSRRREEEGTVLLELSAREKSGAPRDVRVVGSSGFPMLDESALRSMRASRVQSNCPGQRFRVARRFEFVKP